MTRDDLLQAIIDHPDDDPRRLAFASWLEDHGDIQRAEFIRLQIDLAKLPKGDIRRPALEQRTLELLAANENAWVQAIRPWILSWTFQRGFVADVTVTVAMYQEHTFELVHLAPIQRLRFDKAEVKFSGSARDLVPESMAREALILPLGHGRFEHDDCLVVAVPSPIDVDLLQRVQFILKRNLAPVEAPRQLLEEAIKRHFKGS